MSTLQNKNLSVADLMLGLDRFPVVAPDMFLKQALEEMGKQHLGIVCVVDSDSKLLGILTDGDVRRKLLQVQKPFSALFSDDVIDHAKTNPTVVSDNAPLTEAIAIMEDKQIWDLPVVGGDGKLVGLLHLHPVVQALLESGQ
jgi:CBS domain-containing protein